MMGDTVRLGPCPWCGHPVERTAWAVGKSPITGLLSVVCENGDCGAQGPSRRTPAEAIAAWNGPRACDALPPSIQEALNSGDGTYRP